MGLKNLQIIIIKLFRRAVQTDLFDLSMFTSEFINTLLEIQPSTELVETLTSIPKGLEKPVSSKGRWLVLVSTGSQNDAGTKERVAIELCGLKGQSHAICLNTKDELNPNSIKRLEVSMTVVVQYKLCLVVRGYASCNNLYETKGTVPYVVLKYNDLLCGHMAILHTAGRN